MIDDDLERGWACGWEDNKRKDEGEEEDVQSKLLIKKRHVIVLY